MEMEGILQTLPVSKGALPLPTGSLPESALQTLGLPAGSLRCQPSPKKSGHIPSGLNAELGKVTPFLGLWVSGAGLPY